MWESNSGHSKVKQEAAEMGLHMAKMTEYFNSLVLQFTHIQFDLNLKHNSSLFKCGLLHMTIR